VTRQASLEYKPFLDGLRAIAVLVVILYHLGLRGFDGGYLGVDIFFVLSGYLITRLLIDEKERTGRIDFLRFYARRARRLLPALYLLLLAVVVLGPRIYAAASTSTVARDALSSLLYAANWSFIVFRQSYFDSFADPSPLRHMWSLAVEEQFYMLWPLAVLALPMLHRRGMAVVTALAAASILALALLHDPTAPSRAYYGTDARIHEPLIGALAALIATRHRARLAPLRHAAVPCLLAIAGFVVLLGDRATAYYQGLSTVFCLVTALLILGLDTPGSTPVKWLLSSRPAVWLGKISYGMYLWHWPIVIAVPLLWPTTAAVQVAAVLGLTLAISALSYHVIERPIRQAPSVAGRAVTPPRALTAAAIAAAVVAVPIVLALRSSSEPAWASDEFSVSGSGGYRIAVIGDSIAKSLVPGFEQVAQERGWTVIDGARGGCSVAGGYQVDPHGKGFSWSNRCAKTQVATLEWVAAARPDVIVWDSHSETNDLLDLVTRLPAVHGSAEHDQLVRQGWDDALERLPDVPILIVAALHGGPGRSIVCARTPGHCADDGSDGKVAHLNALLALLPATHPRVQVISVADMVCPSGPPCPTSVNGMVMRPDGHHYSEDAAVMIARRIAAQLPIERR